MEAACVDLCPDGAHPKSPQNYSDSNAIVGL